MQREYKMSVKVKNALIRTVCYLLSGVGSALVVVFQYVVERDGMLASVKIIIPCLIALLVAFLIYYKSIKEKINRKLIAIETAKEIGKTPKTNTIISTLLEALGIVIPLLLMATIFVIGGEYLVQIGKILFEILGLFSITIIGNMICDANSKQEMKEKELKKAQELADIISKKIPKQYK